MVRMRQQQRTRFPTLFLAVAACTVAFLDQACVNANPSEDDNDKNKNMLNEESVGEEGQRIMSGKAWYLQKIEIRWGEGKDAIQLPFSPATVAVAFFTLYYLSTALFGSSSGGRRGPKVSCEASHILLMDHSKEAKDKLVAFKQTIQSDPQLFAKHAKKHSVCPSKASGGNLGQFGPGDMAPPFDRVCFDPATPLQTTVGPVQTNFGWHLIYVHTRQLPSD